MFNHYFFGGEVRALKVGFFSKILSRQFVVELITIWAYFENSSEKWLLGNYHFALSYKNCITG